MSATFTEFITLEKVSCGNCGGFYALSLEFLNERRKLSGGWTCPYCKQFRGFWDSELDKARKELEAAQVALRAAKCEAINARDDAEKSEAKLKRKMNRVSKGVCPCCNRMFSNLARHMASKHPEPKQL